MFPTSIDLSGNAYHEALDRGKKVLDCIGFMRYMDMHDDIYSIEEIQSEIDEHYEWFNKVMPHLVPWLDAAVFDLLSTRLRAMV